ncbi:hypothetical protein GCM10028819_00050 [Spirosoma humi]
MFDLNPLNQPDALIQHWVMGIITFVLGIIIGYLGRKRLVYQLEERLESIKRSLTDCIDESSVYVEAPHEEEIVLNRIRSRASELNFNRISSASFAEADDLKVIVGVGPFIEKKLHAIGIYTYRQIANFDRADIDQVNEIIEFFPGRIERDDWVGQATVLAREKKNKSVG